MYSNPMHALVRSAAQWKEALTNVGQRDGISYVGIARSNNAGDAVLYKALVRLLPTLALVPLNSEGGAQRVRTLNRMFAGLGPHAVLLGGGTLIGSRLFRSIIEMVGTDKRVATLGVGVLDPEYRPSVGIRDELHRWIPLLERIQPLTVRGPQSAETLAQLGIESDVVGDPVLALADIDRWSPPSPNDRVVGINAGVNRSFFGSAKEQPVTMGRWDAAQGDFLRRFQTFGRMCQRNGWRLRIFSVWPYDDPYLNAFITSLDPSHSGCELVRWADDPAAFWRALANCHLIVGTKLHAVVFAACVGVPGIMVGYQPKCFDFQRSIGREEWSVRTDLADPDQLLDWTNDVVATRPHHVAEMAGHISDIQVRQRTAARHAMERLAT